MAQILNNLAKGMIRKTNHLKKDPQFYNFALNISTDKNYSDRLTRVTENKLEDYYSLKNVDYIILNALYLDLDEYVYFITDKTSSFSEIVHYKNGAINTLYNNQALNFNASYPISSTYRVDYSGNRIVYFVDGFNKDRVINIDTIELSDHIELLAINPIYGYSSNIDYNIDNGNGSLPNGKYYIFIAPKDKNFKTAQFKYLIDGIPIENGDYKSDLFKSQITTEAQLNEFKEEQTSFSGVYGLKEDVNVPKSVVIDTSILNDDFEYMDVYVIVQDNTEYKVYLRENFSISDIYYLNSLDNFIELGSDISAILVDNVIYNKSETLIQKDNRLILANTNLESYDIDFQAIANQIKVKPLMNYELFKTWDGIAVRNEIEYEERGRVKSITNSSILNVVKNENKTFSTPYIQGRTQKPVLIGKTFMRDEVYALGVYFELENGSFTDVYHIPGRALNVVDTDRYGYIGENGRTLSSITASEWDSQEITVDTETAPAWKIINTGLDGMMGYYRTEEVYPDGYGFPTDGEKNSSGKSYIRHHRIPSDFIYPMLHPDYTKNGKYVTSKKGIISLQFSNINIPTEHQSKIKKAHFSFADRTEGDKKVITKGIVYTTRNVNNIIRNSEVLNAPVSYNSNIRSRLFYEFKSADVDFNFKNFNIKSAYIKPNYIMSGWVINMTKIFTTQLDFAESDMSRKFPFPGAYINYEGINKSTTNVEQTIYDYKQEFVPNKVHYHDVKKVVNFRQYQVEDSIFVDNNSITELGQTVRFEGNQNTALVKLKRSQGSTFNDIFEFEDTNIYLSDEFKVETTNTTKLFRNFYFENNEGFNSDYSEDERSIAKFDNRHFFDTTMYCTLLSNNPNIFSNIIGLTYNKLVVTEDNIAQGDCFIENHYTKKGYSSVVNGFYTTIKSDYRAKDRIVSNVGPNILAHKESDLDMSVNESYITFPVESRINIRMRRHDGEFNHYPYNILNSIYPVNVLEKQSLKQEVFKLNTQYLKEKSIRPLFANTLKISDLTNQTKKIGNRIIYSELQNNESTVDNFRNFKSNNYKDIITTKGNINRLFVKDNKLFIITRDSIFVIGSSNNYLTTKGGSDIYVGSGEFLSAEPEELISLETGFAGTSSKLSFSENKFGYMFVDIIRNKIILFDKTLEDINTYGLLEDLEINLFKHFPELNTGLDKPLLGYGVLTGFDPNTDRLFVTKLDFEPTQLLLDKVNSNTVIIKDGLFYSGNNIIDFSDKDHFINKSFTTTFDGISKSWISYHDYFPNYYIPNPSILKVKLDDIKKYGKDFADRFILDVTMNENFNIVKVFDSLKFDIKSEDKDGFETDNFFNKIIVYNDNQTTGEIDLNSNPFNNNLTKKETYWNYNYILDNSKELKDKRLFTTDWNIIKSDYYIDKKLDSSQIDFSKPWNKKHRLRDKYINIRLIKENLENNKFFINFVIANIRQSIR